MFEERATEINGMVEQIRPILAGHSAAAQGAALADCLAFWLAGHDCPGDEDATRSTRAELLAMHCSAVRLLTSINAKLLGTTP